MLLFYRAGTGEGRFTEGAKDAKTIPKAKELFIPVLPSVKNALLSYLECGAQKVAKDSISARYY
jgi:hypothetical protein